MRIIVLRLKFKPKCSGELASIISSSLLISHGIRRNVKLYVLFNEGYLYIDGRNVRNLRPDYESMCGLVRAALDGRTRYGIVYSQGEPNIVVDKLFVLSNKGLHLVDALLKCASRNSEVIGLTTLDIADKINTNKVYYVYFDHGYKISHIITVFNYVLDVLRYGTWNGV